MRNLKVIMKTAGLVVLAIVGLGGVLHGQEGSKTPPPRVIDKAVKPLSVYRLEFTVREVEDGKRLNSRTYVMSVEDGSGGKVSVGNRVPYSAGSSFQYEDVGINIDCTLHEREGYVLLQTVGIDISSVVKGAEGESETHNPVFRNARARVAAAVTPGKPTMITSLDDVSSNRRYEVEVTATKVK